MKKLRPGIANNKYNTFKILNAVPNPIFIIDIKDDVFVYINNEFSKLTGYISSEIISKHIYKFEFVDLKFVNSVKKFLDDTDSFENFKSIYTAKNSNKINAVFNGRIIKDGLNSYVLITVNRVEIEENNTNEYKADKNINVLKLLSENSRELICSHSPDGKYAYISPSVVNVLGYSQEELLGKLSLELIHPEDRNRIEKYYQGDLKASISLNPIKYRIRKKSGNYAWFETYFRRVLNPADDTVRIETSSINITPKEIAIDALKESDERYASLISILDEGVVVHSKKGFVKIANKSAWRILGGEVEDIFSFASIESKLKLMREDGFALTFYEFPSITALRTGKPCLNKIIGFMKHDNGPVWITVNSLPIYLQGKNKPQAVITVISDITKKKNIEHELANRIKELEDNKETIRKNTLQLTLMNEKLRLSEKKLIELNQNKDKFFSIISHDLRSPFDSLFGFTSIIMEEYDVLTDKEIKDYIYYINDSAKHLYNLLDNMLQWSKINSGRVVYSPISIDLDKKINEIFNLVKAAAIKKNIELTYKADGRYLVFADDNMLRSILQNLIVNGIKFTNPGGYVRINASQINDKVEISIIDSGVGMSKNIINNLFVVGSNITRNGTAKEKGTGLGLILCKELIEKNRGKIIVESKEGRGTQFTFTLPARCTT